MMRCEQEIGYGKMDYVYICCIVTDEKMTRTSSLVRVEQERRPPCPL